MARKDLLKSVLGQSEGPKSDTPRTDYAIRGASKSMRTSIDAMAENSKRLLEGETIVEIDPALVDGSFVKDRLSIDDAALDELRSSVERSGQDTPVLVRPHPHKTGRYMAVFGHRRIRVARDLGRTVRAVVKELDDVGHILAQGQENTARADLSFIEKALFAKNLNDLGQSKDVIQQSLTIDGTVLSRMLSIANVIPGNLIEAIGPAKSIGRDRWEDLKRLISAGTNVAVAERVIEMPEFEELEDNKRFELLLSKVSEAGRTPSRQRKKAAASKRTWVGGGGRIKGVLGRSGKAYSISLTAKDSAAFGEFLAANLDQLYADFLNNSEDTER